MWKSKQPSLKQGKALYLDGKKGKKGAHEYTQHADVAQSCFRGCDATVKLRSNKYINETDASIKMQLIIIKKSFLDPDSWTASSHLCAPYCKLQTCRCRVPVSSLNHCKSCSWVHMQPVFLIIQCHHGTAISNVRKKSCLSQLRKAHSTESLFLSNGVCCHSPCVSYIYWILVSTTAIGKRQHCLTEQM